MIFIVLLVLGGVWLWPVRRSERKQVSVSKIRSWFTRRSGRVNGAQHTLLLDAAIIRELAALLRSGVMFRQAVEALLKVRDEPCPVLETLRRMNADARILGENHPLAQGSAHRVADSSVDRLVWCLNLSARTGAPLAAVLDQLAEDLEAELLARQSFDAAMAGPRATTRLLTWLPVLGLGAGFLLGIDVGHTLMTSWIAQLSVVVGAGLWILNRLWCRRLMVATTTQALK